MSHNHSPLNDCGDKFIEFCNVSKDYQLGDVIVPALKNINLAIKKGAFMSIVGPSGSGKTTLLNLLAGLDVPGKGEIFFNGLSIKNLSRSQLANLRLKSIGIIFQSFNLIPVLTVYENVEYPLLLQNIPKTERRQRVAHLLEAVGFGSRHHHKPDELSGGQRQRVGIARALVTRPSLIIADEPSANLDSHTALSIIDIMHRLNKEEGATFIFSTHDNNIVRLTDEVIRLKDGEICSLPS
ncbi:MAG: ABC transporter ATP-binding protein [Nitrospinae bacterium]|nr:ABC transporter ATP-binding protein [Nitrospinota bacterium]